MTADNIQKLLFQEVKARLAPHLSLVDEVSECLHISNDSAYRRIRGEKLLSLEEASVLCSSFNISLDHALDIKSDSIIFHGRIDMDSATVFEDYLGSMLKQLMMVDQYENKHIYFLLKDIPPFDQFLIPELAAFKFYLWNKSILHNESLRSVKFRIDDPRFDAYFPVSRQIIETYNRIPVTEIWNLESINSTLRQIRFYRDSGAFETEATEKLLYEKLKELVNHLERQAELELKFLPGKTPTSDSGSYRVFVNDLILGDNTFAAEMNGQLISFLNHSVLYFLGTTDPQFNQNMFRNLKNLMKKSAMISGVGEKERAKFFNKLRQKLDACIATV
jgi:hypothetical protein